MASLLVQLLTIAIIALQRQQYHNRGLRLSQSPDAVWWSSEYDFVIVGSGTAGSILASRLTENAAVSVLLIEAGGPVTVMSDTYSTYYYLNHVWPYRTVPQRYSALRLRDRRVSYPRGRILGGSSTVNYGVYIRGSRASYDEWSSRYGATGWTFAENLPYFIRSENNTDSAVVRENPDYHGTSGPLQVSSCPNPDPILSNWSTAAERMGFPIRDLNGPEQYGCAILQTTQSPFNWTRQSTYSAYIEPIIEARSNLHVLVNSLVTRVLFTDNGLNASGVEFVRNGQTYRVKARREVILSAGTINSAQLLMLAGIGPRQHLEELGIPVRTNLPVGEFLQDHFIIPIDFMVNNASNIVWSNGHSQELNAEHLYEFLANSNGPLTRMPGLEMFMATGVNGDQAWPDGAFYFLINQKYYNISAALDNYDPARAEEWRQYMTPIIANVQHFQLVFSVFRPLSSGTIRLASRSPYDYPLIDPNYLSNPQDLVALVRTMSIGLQIAESEQMSALISPYIRPIPGCEFCPNRPLSQCYTYLACAGRTYTETTSHPVGSCRMGGQNFTGAVVDERLRVRGGVTRLRVIDASVMPAVVNANTNAAVIMIGERGADLIKQDHDLL